MSLQAVFEDFKRNKKALKQIHDDTVECFEKIQESLAQRQHGRELATQLVQDMTCASSDAAFANADLLDESMIHVSIPGVETTNTSLSKTLYTEAERKDICRLFDQKPSLIVVGQTNSGKSSIINEILECKVVTTSEQPCTSRIVKLTYSDEKYARLVDRNGQVLQNHKLQSTRVPRELIELKQGEREKTEIITATIEAGFDIPFLKSGVDIIDSPGRNENQELDNLVRTQLDNILPFIVYVIDGHNLFTALDKEVLKEITDQNKDMEIFYVVSKLEPQEQDSSDEDSEEDDEDEEDSNETVQENKKRRVLEQLVGNGLLVRLEENGSMENFHGLSAWKLNEYRRRKKKNPNWNDPGGMFKEYTDAFDRFQTSLQTFSETNLKAIVKRSCQKLISVISRCLLFFIEKANTLKQSRDATMCMLKSIEKEEQTLHGNVSRQIEKQRDEILEVMTEAIHDLRSDAGKKAKKLKYSEEFIVPTQDGYVRGAAAVNQCRAQIEQMVFNQVRERMKETLVKMFGTRDTFLEELEQRISGIEKEAISEEHSLPHTASTALHSNLVSCYNVDSNYKENSQGLMKLLKHIGETIKNFFIRPLTTIRGRVNVGDPEWKKKVALDTLKGIEVKKVVEELVKNLKDHFDSCHGEFLVGLKNIVDVLKRGETLKDDQRNAILKFAPDVASLEMLCHSVNDLLKYGRPQKGDTIGAGAQGTVVTCTNIVTPSGKPCVVKVVPVSSENLLKDLTLELHTTRSLSHPNILPIVCTIIEPNLFSGITVSIVSERMKCDLHHALPSIPSLRTRLGILLDTALALKYLHDKDLMHRDVKLQNVLVDDDNHGYLTDMGLCKAEGLATGSLVGTPIAMAPEMIQQQYDKSVDVYAFGILMWRVCEGQGNQPANIFLFPVPVVMLIVNAKDQRKPERLEKFSPPCWALMEKCWETVPERRPSFDVIIHDLKEILADKSIR